MSRAEIPARTALRLAVDACAWVRLVELSSSCSVEELNSPVAGGGRSALHAASAAGAKHAVTALLNAGADIHIQGAAGSTPLHLAAWEGHEDTVKELLAADADARSVTHALRTPLHFAARRGHVDVVEILVSAGAQRDAREKDGFTALHLAAREGHVSVAKVLVAAGARVALLDNNGQTAAQCAAAAGHADIVLAILEAPGILQRGVNMLSDMAAGLVLRAREVLGSSEEGKDVTEGGVGRESALGEYTFIMAGSPDAVLLI